MDLDPKGANNQIKEAIDKRYLPEDEEPVTEDFLYDSGRKPSASGSALMSLPVSAAEQEVL